MALMKAALLRSFNIHLKRTTNFQINKQCHWWPDYKAGPVPKTKEERIAAANKYNLLPEEYKPLKDQNDVEMGDYPDLPLESTDARDPYFDWDYPNIRRNFEEPVHMDMLMYTPEWWSTKEDNDLTTRQALCAFFGFIGSCLFFCWIISDRYMLEPVTERQLGFKGVTHYTFELDYEELKKPKIECECPDKE